MTLLKIWFMSWSVLGLSCFRPKYIRAKVGIGPKYYLSRSIPRAEMCLRPKYAWGQSEWGAKVLFRPNWVWAVRCPCPPWSKKNLQDLPYALYKWGPGHADLKIWRPHQKVVKIKDISTFVWRIWKWKEKRTKISWPSGAGICNPDF